MIRKCSFILELYGDLVYIVRKKCYTVRKKCENQIFATVKKAHLPLQNNLT